MNIINTFPHPDASKCDFTIALIDSDYNLNNHIAQKLCAVGASVLQAFTSDEIAGVLVQNPDFIILDPIFDACDEFKLREYLRNPQAAGVVIFAADTNQQRREYLFESGILEFFSKEEPLEDVANEFIRLFKTIKHNGAYHVSMIGGSEFSQQKFKQLVMHRDYQLCFLDTCSALMDKWNDSAHELPDLLILDFTSPKHLEEALSLIHFVRIIKLSEIPIVLLLNETEVDYSSKFYRMGVNSILVRPYPYEKLLSKITHHLDYQISKKWLHHEQSISNQLRAMIDVSSIVSKADPRGIITYVNDAFCEITGYTREELIGVPHSIVRHPENYPLFFEQMWETLKNKKMFRGIIKNRRKDGSSYYVDSTISAILDDNDTIIEYISIRHDITSLIEKQHEIEEQRSRIQNVLDAQTSLICMVDKSRGVVQSNRGFMEFLGIKSLDPKECGFVNLSDLFLDADDLFHIDNNERLVCLDRLYDMRGQFIKVAMKDRFFNHHVFAIHVEKVQDNHFTKGICYLVSFEDITELNRALREAKASSEAESRFLATMSHEIRTPLNGILGFAELLSETPLNEQQKKYLKTIEYSGETLRQIINDILDVMKFDREELELHLEPINIIGELESIIYPFYSIAHKKEVDLLVFIDPKLPTSVDVDFLRLKQVLINLLSNAIKFTPSGKKVYVRIKKLKTADGKVTIGFTVADEGIGVRPEQKENIFKPFVQADNSISREFGGTGLGLNIVTRIIAAMNGKISFKSTFGRGSVFNVLFEFSYNADTPSYQCQVHTTHLYLPQEKPTERFLLVERYLHRFACCDSHIFRDSTLDTLVDEAKSHIIAFMDMMSVQEIHDMIKRFTHAKIFIIPSHMSTYTAEFSGENVIFLDEEISWSTIAHRLEIDDQHIEVHVEEPLNVTFDNLYILIAEDNEVNQLYIEELLNRLNIKHDLAHDGYQAVKKFMTGSYDLVLMDINMPNMDGITATGQILQYEKETGAKHTPIIGLSADAVAKNITLYLSQGLDGYLIKPLRKSELTQLLNDYCPSYAITKTASAKSPAPVVHDTRSLIASVASKIELPEEIVVNLFKKFITNSETILTQFKEEHEDAAALKMAVHSLKGISRNLYLEALGNNCETLEKALPNLDSEEKINRLAALSEETRKIITQMESELVK
ncbi:MAG: response regulator [Sulfuricurvum sp.]|nr:response regulator [Sulfuricurvum sp.]